MCDINHYNYNLVYKGEYDLTNYTIAEEFKLPSNGKVYSVDVTPSVKLRSMTTEEEMKRLAPSDRAYKNLCEIIDDCIIGDPGISVYDMCLADYQFLLHKLRVVTYGAEYPVTTVCPYCAHEADHVVDMNDLPVTEYNPDEFAKYIEFTLPVTKKHIKLRLQTPRMVDDVTERDRELKKKSKGKSQDSAFLFSLQSLIETVDGEKLDPVKREDFVRSLPMMDTNYIMKHAEKLVESFGVDNTMEFRCPLCGLDYTTSFRITKEFFGPTVHF